MRRLVRWGGVVALASGAGFLGGVGTGSGGGEAAAAASADAGVRCDPSPTRPSTDLRGRVISSRLRVVGNPTIVAGPFRGRRALLELSPTLGSKLYHQLDLDGPRTFAITARRLDAPGRGLFEVHHIDARGRTVRRFVPVLRLDRERMRRSQPPRRGEVLLGQPGSIVLPAAGCYRLRIRWPGGGWDRRFVAREKPLPSAPSAARQPIPAGRP